MYVVLGNRHAHAWDAAAAAYVREPRGKRACQIKVREDAGVLGAAQDITAPDGSWARNSYGDPAWVAGDNEQLVKLLADHYGCPIRDLEDK